MPVERIAAFIRGEPGDSFEKLALTVFRHQHERDPDYRALCDRRGAAPDRVADWREVPAIARSAGGEAEPAGEESEIDRHDPDLLATVIDRSFPAVCLRRMGRPPVLSIVPPGGTDGDPWPGFAADRLLRSRAAPDSTVAVAPRGVEAAKARSFLAARQRDRRPTVVLATPATLDRLLEALKRRGLRFRLPAGSRVIVAGRRATEAPDLPARLAEGLAVPPENVAREWAAGGLVSRFYAGHRRRGEPRPFRPPPWTRVRILDPDTLAEAPAGARGRIAVFDLASLASVAHLLTDERGVAGEDGFRPAEDAPSTAGSGCC